MSIILLVGLLIAFLLPLGLAVLLTGFVTFFARRLRKNAYVSFLNYAISNWITFVILLVFVFPEAGLSLTSVGFKGAISLGEIGLALLFVVGSVSWFAFNARLKILKMKKADFKVESWKHISILVFSSSLTAGFCEEFFFRGFAITALHGELSNIWIAGLISSAVFAVMHIRRYGLGGFLQIGVVGLLLMTLFIVTGSIYPGIIMHSVNNLFGFVLVPVLFRKSQDNAITD